MQFTVENALKIEPLNRGRLIAGEGGLGNSIQTVSVQEVNPLDESVSSSADFIPSGNLMISALYPVRSDIQKQVKMIRLMQRRKTSALILCHVGLILKQVAPEVIAVCDELNFPLILMPPNVGYNEIILAVSDVLLDQKNAEFRYILDIYNTFTSLILKEKGIGGVISALSRMTSHAFLYYNHSAKLEHASCQDIALQQYISAYVSAHAVEFPRSMETRTIPTKDQHSIISLMPVYNNFTYFGILVAVCTTELTKLDEIAIAQAKNTICISNNNKVRYEEQYRHLVEDFINDLVRGDCRFDEILNRSTALGIDLRRARAFLLLGAHNTPGSGRSPYLESSSRGSLYAFLRSELSVLSPESICCLVNGTVGILLMEPPENAWNKPRVLALAGKLVSQANYAGLIPVSAGIGAITTSAEELPGSYLTAFYALTMAQHTGKEPGLVSYQDFPVCILLLQAASTWDQLGALRVSVEELFRPLVEYDTQKNTNLMETFRILLSCNLDTSQAADFMFLHKNTVLQRKKKITSLCSGNPFLGMSRLQYELAFFLKDTLPN